MYFYEPFHDGTSNTYDAFCLLNYSFPYHFHRCYEIISILSGQMKVTINDSSYLLHSGDTIIIFPNQLHSFKTIDSSEVVFIIFAPDLIRDFSNEYRSFEPSSLIIHDYPISLKSASVTHTYAQKALLYQICNILAQRPKVKRSGGLSQQLSLLHTILTYMQENFHSPHCSLQSLAQQTGYDYSYLSKYFSQKMNISYTGFLNQLRIQSACALLEDTDYPISDIAFQCGYDTIRTFNRNFILYVGKSPRAYRSFH